MGVRSTGQQQAALDSARQDDGSAPSVSRIQSLDVVIVTYASEPLIRQCLTSLLSALPSVPVHVYVMDNDSPDHTAAVIEAEYPEVTLVRRGSNSGFAVACNEAYRLGTSDAVLFLNPDTRVESGALEHLVGELEAEPDIGVLGCRLLTADGSLDHAAKRTVPSPLQAAQYFLLRLVRRRGSAYVRGDVPETAVADVDAVNGAFMLVRRAVADQVGLLDEAYWMYGEDLDWCVRFRAAGFRVVYDGRVVVHHLKGGSTGGLRSPHLNYHFHRSMAIFYRSHLARGRLVDAAVLGAIWVRFAGSVAAQQVSRLVRSAAPAVTRRRG